MVQYFEEYDNGGTSDYTKEKYELSDYLIKKIWAMRK